MSAKVLTTLTPFQRKNYVEKLNTLVADLANKDETTRFLQLVGELEELSAAQIKELNIVIPSEKLLDDDAPGRVGIL